MVGRITTTPIVTIRSTVATVGRVLIGAVLGVTAVAALAGAPGDASPTAAADARFAALMVPHHEAGIALDDLALRRTDDVRVRHLAFEMNSYQGRELDDLRDLAGDAAPGPAHPDGMPSPTELADLATRTGADFDRAFLTLMIRHHEGAVTMAERDGRAGTGAGVRAMADTLVRVQTDQLSRMRDLLAELG